MSTLASSLPTVSAAPAPRQRRKPGRLNPSQWLPHALVLVGALIMLAPFYFMFVFATHTNTDILSVPPPLWFGDALLDNLNELVAQRPMFWRSVGLSLWIATASTVLNLFLCSLGGYGFSMYEFRGRDKLFAALMATMLLPAFVGMIPYVLMMKELGWLNSTRALIIPGACSAFGIFLMRQYIGSAVPRELVEAARMDGCGEFGIYWRVVLPLIGPAMGTLGLVTFIGSYNNFVGALLVMSDMEMFTAPLVLRSLQGTGQTPWGAISAGSAVTVLPLLVLFVLYSRRLIEGLTAGAVKG
ncbi:carbohydrate ABC transporter permease [Piscinibacter sp. HJYY11]|uniref:carbohydrate ABC transporter permease n=1 Tax=Piscinibacter sp. HJYY11 TaxID=2801333 RepID=UPI00191E3033|nr:carbohydrate ABC transporter permease [Piscinibacter sp. HJYY11]MBL0727644.1 carbohydrate ABC transporter permease [Piscinibacter sp. HJYY11]